MRPDDDAPTVTHQQRFASDLAEQRRATDERTGRDRLAAAIRAVEACGLQDAANVIGRVLIVAGLDTEDECLAHARDAVQRLRARLLDGSDEPRFRACNMALQALGALWAVS